MAFKQLLQYLNIIRGPHVPSLDASALNMQATHYPQLHSLVGLGKVLRVGVAHPLLQ